MEDQVDDLKQKVEELTAELKMTKSQLVQARVQQEALVSALRSERTLRKKKSTASARNSADVDDLMEKSEKMANIGELRGQTYQLLARYQANGDGKMAGLNGSENKEDKSLWTGSVEIAEHSNGDDRMRSSNLVRRLSQEKRNPRTSTPVSNSNHDSPSYLDESQGGATKTESIESENIRENTEKVKSADITLAEEQNTRQDKSRHQGDLRNASSREPRKRSSKRDSGISVDASPTPST